MWNGSICSLPLKTYSRQCLLGFIASCGSLHLRVTPFTLFVASASLPVTSKLALSLTAVAMLCFSAVSSCSSGCKPHVMLLTSSPPSRWRRASRPPPSPRSVPLAWSTCFILSESFSGASRSPGMTFTLTRSPWRTTSSTASTCWAASCEMCTSPCLLYPSTWTKAPKGLMLTTTPSWMLDGGGSESTSTATRSERVPSSTLLLDPPPPSSLGPRSRLPL
mmetsp:Transcript_41049/g.95851  ORF Transcript_41049/g.95851 Transcript_41049/m.95851 type:complete len:220 (+) Transcript_41049:777-1436(+)